VLCAPLILKNAVTGILYLENNLAARVFTPDRLELLKLIASQAAISLENARLYAEHRQAEETARASQQRFQNLFENAPLYICEVDLTQTPAVVLQANPRLRQIYGWTEEAFVLPAFEQLMPPEALPGVTRMMQRVRAGKTVTIESVMRAGDGSLFPIRLTVAPEPDPTGVNRIIAVVEDITAEKQRRSEAEAINEDRRRIAHEIHDGLAQNLLGLRMRAGLWHKLVETDPARLHSALDEMREILSASIDEVRRSIFALRPIELDDEGFFPALRQFIAAAREQYRLEIALEIFGPEERLPASLELTLFRVIQEALNNVIKHAQANHVWIRLDLEKSDRLTLTLQDDGVGFDPTQLELARRDGHLGLKQMQERVEQAQGVLSIASRPSEGMMLQLTLLLT
jgi:PAS domain S-box-containing protein